MSDSDEDKVLQTWLDLDAIQFPELPEVSQEPDYGALAGITADDWAVMISGGDPTEAAMGQQLARQARTIRRLFTAYFLAKGRRCATGRPQRTTAPRAWLQELRMASERSAPASLRLCARMEGLAICRISPLDWITHAT